MSKSVIERLEESLSEYHGSVVEIRAGLDNTREQIGGIQKTVDAMANEIRAGLTRGYSGDSNTELNTAKVSLGNWARTGKLPVSASMTTNSDPDGGFLVPETLDREIARVSKDFSPMRRVARVIAVPSERYSKLFNTGGTGANWASSETSATSETANPKFVAVTPPMGRLEAEPRVSQMLLDDAGFDVAGELITDIGEAFGLAEGAAFVSGDGVGKPRGFLTMQMAATNDASRAYGKLQYKVSGVSAALTDSTHNGGDAILDLVYSLRPGYRQNAAFVMNSATAGTVRKFKDDNGQYLWQNGLAAGQPAILCGYPVEIDENMPDVGAGLFPVAFGDWQRGYMITDRLGINLLRDPYTQKPWTKFYTTKRVGGHVYDTNAIKLLKVSA